MVQTLTANYTKVDYPRFPRTLHFIVNVLNIFGFAILLEYQIIINTRFECKCNRFLFTVPNFSLFLGVILPPGGKLLGGKNHFPIFPGGTRGNSSYDLRFYT